MSKSKLCLAATVLLNNFHLQYCLNDYLSRLTFEICKCFSDRTFHVEKTLKLNFTSLFINFIQTNLHVGKKVET